MGRTCAGVGWGLACPARPQNRAGGLCLWVGCKLLVTYWHYARHAISEALLRWHRLANRQSHPIRWRGTTVYAWRFCIRDARNSLDRRADFRNGLAGAGVIDCRRWANVLGHLPLLGPAVCESVLSGAGCNRLLRFHPFR